MNYAKQLTECVYDENTSNVTHECKVLVNPCRQQENAIKEEIKKNDMTDRFEKALEGFYLQSHLSVSLSGLTNEKLDHSFIHSFIFY